MRGNDRQTQMLDGEVVSKTDPNIILMGKIDSLYACANVIRESFLSECENTCAHPKTDKLVGEILYHMLVDLEDLIQCVASTSVSDQMHDYYATIQKQLRDKDIWFERPLDKWGAALDYLRTQIREAETYAASFPRSAYSDFLCLVLNAMSLRIAALIYMYCLAEYRILYDEYEIR